jgi:ABC-type multidrug transport system ATPase subunit
MTVIYVDQLHKSYRRRLPVAEGADWGQRWRDRWRPRYESKPAVTNLSFSVESGEKIAFIGPQWRGQIDYPENANRYFVPHRWLC